MAKGKAGRIPTAVKKKVWKLYALGRTHREIQTELGEGGTPLSIGSIANVVAEGRKIEPDFDQIRQCYVNLKKVGADALAALRGCQVLDALQQSGFVAKDWQKLLSLSKDILTGRPIGVIDAATELLHLENQTGKRYPQLLKNYQDITAKTAQLSQRIDQLTERERELKGSIQGLDEAQKVSQSLRRQGITPNELDKFLALYLEHKELGLHRYLKVLGEAESLQQVFATLQRQEKEERSKVVALEKERSILQEEVSKLAEERKAHEELRKSLGEETEQSHAQWRQAKRDLAHILKVKDDLDQIMAAIKDRRGTLGDLESSIEQMYVRWNQNVEKIEEGRKKKEEELAQITQKVEARRDEFDAFTAFTQLLQDPSKVAYGTVLRFEGLVEVAAKAMMGEKTPRDKMAQDTLEKAKATLVEMIEGMVQDRMVAAWRYDSVRKDLGTAKADLASAKETHRQELSAKDASWEKRLEDSEASFQKKLQESEAVRAKVQRELEAKQRELEHEKTNASSVENRLREQLDSERASSKKLRDELEGLREVEKLVGDQKIGLEKLDAHFKQIKKAEIEAQATAQLERLKKEEWPRFVAQQYEKRIQEGVDFEVNMLHRKRLQGEILPLLLKGVGREIAHACDRCGKRLSFILRENTVNNAITDGHVEAECPNPLCGEGWLAPRGILGMRGPHMVKVSLVDILRQIE